MVTSGSNAAALLTSPAQTELWMADAADTRPSITFDLGTLHDIVGVDIVTTNVLSVRLLSSADGVYFTQQAVLC